MTLPKNKFVIYNFHRSITNIVHFLYPQHLIFRFKLFSYALTLCHLFYQSKKHFLCLLVNVSKIAVQLATCEQGSIDCSFMLPQIAFVPLPPYADRLIFFFGW